MHYIVSTSSSTPAVITNQDSSSLKTAQRRRKGPGHRRTNSKGSVASWTPPSLSAIAEQEKKRASTTTVSNDIIPIPSISANIDSKSITTTTTITNRQLNPQTLKLDLESSYDSQITPTNQQRPSTLFTKVTRKSSSSDQEGFPDSQYSNPSRTRRRRNLNSINNKISSPSSITTRSIKSTPNTPQIDETDNNNSNNNNNNNTSGSQEKNDNDLRRYPRSVSFQFSTSMTTERSPSFQQRKTFNRVIKKKPSFDFIISIACFSLFSSLHVIVHLKKVKLKKFQVIIMYWMMKNIVLNMKI